MLIPAIFFNEESKIAYSTNISTYEGFYFSDSNYVDIVLSIDSTDKDRLQYISYHNNEVLGYFEAKTDLINSLIIEFRVLSCIEKHSITYIRDLLDFLRFILLIRNFRKIVFSSAIDNPTNSIIENKICNKWRIGKKIGEISEYKKLRDNEFHSFAFYEIDRTMFENFFSVHCKYFSVL